MENLTRSTNEVQPHGMSHPTRVFLGRFPQQQRGPICNMFLAPVRAGLASPQRVVEAVREDAQQRAAKAIRGGQPDTQTKMLMLLEQLTAYPQEALELAAWAISWEALPPHQRQQLRAERRTTYQRQYIAVQPPTDRQLACLGLLGYQGSVESRLHASNLIEHLRGGRGHG